MDVLVVQASKHGSTTSIGQAIADRLAERGHIVTSIDADGAAVLGPETVGEHQAVVVGSAIYAGHWMKPARQFVDHNEGYLKTRPLWLFSSGPLGDPPTPAEDPIEAAMLVERLHARDHRLFAGKMEHDELGLAERAMVRAVHAPYGDFRDFDAVRDWADEIADAIA